MRKVSEPTYEELKKAVAIFDQYGTPLPLFVKQNSLVFYFNESGDIVDFSIINTQPVEK